MQVGKQTEQIRSEISKNLHDEVGSTLTNISLGSLLAQKQLKKEGPVEHILERIYQDSQHYPVHVWKIQRPGTKLDWEFLEPRNLLVGSPEHVAERVQELAEVCGLETLLVEHAHPGIPQRLILRNLEFFATKVMPAFRRAAPPLPAVSAPR